MAVSCIILIQVSASVLLFSTINQRRSRMPRASAAGLVKRGDRIQCNLPHERIRGLGKETVPCGKTLLYDDGSDSNIGKVRCGRCSQTHSLVELLVAAIGGSVWRAYEASDRILQLVWLARLEKVAHQLSTEFRKHTLLADPFLPAWIRENYWQYLKHCGFVPVVWNGQWYFVGVSERELKCNEIPSYLLAVAQNQLLLDPKRLSLPPTSADWQNIVRTGNIVLAEAMSKLTLFDQCKLKRHWIGNPEHPNSLEIIVGNELTLCNPAEETPGLCFILVRPPNES